MQYEFEREPGFVRLHNPQKFSWASPVCGESGGQAATQGLRANLHHYFFQYCSRLLLPPGQVTQRQHGRLNRRVAEEVFRTSRKRWRKNGNPQRLSLDNEGDLFATLSLLRHEGWVDVDVTWATAANFIDWVKAAATSTMLCCVFCVMKYSISLWKDSW